MMYFESDQDHWLVWPVLAISLRDEFWIGLGWLNFELGWRAGDGGWNNEAKGKSYDYRRHYSHGARGGHGQY